jgi:hypothetical protein
MEADSDGERSEAAVDGSTARGCRYDHDRSRRFRYAARSGGVLGDYDDVASRLPMKDRPTQARAGPTATPVLVMNALRAL